MRDNTDHPDLTVDARRRRFEALYAEHQACVLAYVLRRTDSAHDAADVIAETFLVAWRRLDDAPTGASARLWLFGVARRVLANQRRGERRRTQLAERLRGELASRAVAGAPSGELAELAAAFGSLADGDREVLALEAWEGLRAGEVAAVLGCSRNAARIRLHRARRRLRAAIAASQGPGPDDAPPARAAKAVPTRVVGARGEASWGTRIPTRARGRRDVDERKYLMSTTKPQNLVSSLNPISDADAARAASAQTLADLAAAIVATPAPPQAPRRGRLGESPRSARRAVLTLAVLAGALTALVLGVTAVLSGQTEPQPADAAVLRGAAAALAHPPGSIVIDSDSDVQRTNPKFLKFAPGYKPPQGIQTSRWSNHEITETPVGKGPQNVVNLGGPSVTNGVQIGEVNGNNELYDPTTNTVYISSQYGSDITPGAKPGTFVYTQPKLRTAPPGSGAAQENAHRPPPLTITAAQARALRDGTSQVQTLGDPEHPSTYRMKITPAFRVTPTTAEIQAQLKAGKPKVAGPTTINGREAIKLTSIHGPYGYEYDVAPGTYYPIKEVFRSRAITITTIYSEYRVLPATHANQQLLILSARHPGARIDHNPADYQAAQARLITGS